MSSRSPKVIKQASISNINSGLVLNIYQEELEGEHCLESEIVIMLEHVSLKENQDPF